MTLHPNKKAQLEAEIRNSVSLARQYSRFAREALRMNARYERQNLWRYAMDEWTNALKYRREAKSWLYFARQRKRELEYQLELHEAQNAA